ncbi:MAG: hypothetical protein KGZ25_14945, partial [Planctomycetes bacterium]|nr:hypothetical protein [Planctomycetota bacterium]
CSPFRARQRQGADDFQPSVPRAVISRAIGPEKRFPGSPVIAIRHAASTCVAFCHTVSYKRM